MADIIEPMCCEVVCSLDGGETDFLWVCACGMTVDNGISFLFDEAPLSVLVVVTGRMNDALWMKAKQRVVSCDY